MLGLEWGRVKLVLYDSNWPKLFSIEAERLSKALNINIHDIQHVGSTAIPHMIAKPVLDIAIILPTFESGFKLIEPLRATGYTYMGENGIPNRHFAFRGDPVTHHVQMFEHGSEEWQNMICFRNYMIQNPELAAQYAQLKLALGQKFPNDRGSYRIGKIPFIKRMVAIAVEEYRGYAEEVRNKLSWPPHMPILAH